MIPSSVLKKLLLKIKIHASIIKKIYVILDIVNMTPSNFY